jgi:hypothetical protein
VQPGEQVGWREARGPRFVVSQFFGGEQLTAAAGGAAAEDHRTVLEDPGRVGREPSGVGLHLAERGGFHQQGPAIAGHVDAQASGKAAHLALNAPAESFAVFPCGK